MLSHNGWCRHSLSGHSGKKALAPCRNNVRMAAITWTRLGGGGGDGLKKKIRINYVLVEHKNKNEGKFEEEYRSAKWGVGVRVYERLSPKRFKQQNSLRNRKPKNCSWTNMSTPPPTCQQTRHPEDTREGRQWQMQWAVPGSLVLYRLYIAMRNEK